MLKKCNIIKKLITGKEFCIGEEIKPKAKHLIVRKFQKNRCKDEDDFYESDDNDKREKKKDKKNFGKKDESFQNKSNSNNDDRASFNGQGNGGGGSNDGNGSDEDNNNSSKPPEDPVESEILSLDELVLEAKNRKVVSIFDKSGAGCTTALETIGEKILNEWNSTPWVLLIDMNTQWCLRSDIFDDVESCSYFSFVDKTFEVIKNFEKLSKFNEVSIRNQFQKENLVILWDGIDKVDQKYFEGFLIFLKRIKNMSNVQFVTANRQFRKMETILEVKSFRIVPLSDDDIKLFVETYTENLKIKHEKTAPFLNSSQIYRQTLNTPQMIEALVDVYNSNADFSNMYDVFKKIIKILATKKQTIDVFENSDILKAHQAVAIQTIFGENFVDITNNDNSVNINDIKILSKHPINLVKSYEQSKPYRFIYKHDTQICFHHNFIACFFVAHYILTKILFLTNQPSDMIFRHKLLFFIAKNNDENVSLIKALVIFGINIEEKITNPHNYETIKNNFPCVFKFFEFNTSAIEFLSTCFQHHQEILKHLWNNGKRSGIVFKASHQSGWNMTEICSIARKYFDEKEIITFEVNSKLNVGFQVEKIA